MHNILVILEYTNITGMMLIRGGRGRDEMKVTYRHCIVMGG